MNWNAYRSTRQFKLFATCPGNELETAELSALLAELSHDEAADLVAGLPAEQRQEVLGQLVPSESAKVAELLHYPDDSAGGIMTDQFIALPADATIKDCLETLRQGQEEEYDSVEKPPVFENRHGLTPHAHS